VGLLWAAIYQTIRLRKYGRTRFVPSSLPGGIGGYLGGVIEVPARVVPEADATLTLRCIRREVRGSGKNRRSTEHVLWEREEAIARDRWMTGLGGTSIPVLFYIPPGQPSTDDSDSNNAVLWRLSATAATAGVDFATQFDVPVYDTGETAPPPDSGKPVLEEYRPVALDSTALRDSGIRRDGDTFYFGATHLGGARFTTAALLLGFAGLFAWYVYHGVHGVVWAFTLFFALIIGLFAGSVWFGMYELRIEAADVVVTKPRPWGRKVTRVPRSEVRFIMPAKSMSTGEKQYFRLSLVGNADVDPALPPREGEPFVVRKLRYQLAQAERGGKVPPKAEILAQFKHQPKFIVPFAEHVPGQTRAEAIGEMVLEAIRGK
jgi:hypothetical protein